MSSHDDRSRIYRHCQILKTVIGEIMLIVLSFPRTVLRKNASIVAGLLAAENYIKYLPINWISRWSEWFLCNDVSQILSLFSCRSVLYLFNRRYPIVTSNICWCRNIHFLISPVRK
ncbi:unnamed protein product [Tenebrio molitor]|nr:unnamed protein product [Tenebrio molitor]